LKSQNLKPIFSFEIGLSCYAIKLIAICQLIEWKFDKTIEIDKVGTASTQKKFLFCAKAIRE